MVKWLRNVLASLTSSERKFEDAVSEHRRTKHRVEEAGMVAQHDREREYEDAVVAHRESVHRMRRASLTSQRQSDRTRKVLDSLLEGLGNNVEGVDQ